MQFEWDNNKRLINLQKHNLDFADAPDVFADCYTLGKANMVNGEEREIATGYIDEVCVTVVFTRRPNSIRIISLRRARHAEKQRHQDIFGI